MGSVVIAASLAGPWELPVASAPGSGLNAPGHGAPPQPHELPRILPVALHVGRSRSSAQLSARPPSPGQEGWMRSKQDAGDPSTRGNSA